VHGTRRHDGKRRRQENPVQRGSAKQRAKKMHFSVPVL